MLVHDVPTAACRDSAGLEDDLMPIIPLDAREVVRSPVPLLLARDAAASGVRIRGDRTLVRIRPGVYADRAATAALPPWSRYLVRVHALALVRPDATFSHESAAALGGLPIFGEPALIHLFDHDRAHARRVGDVAVHTSQDAPRTMLCGGVRLTEPSQTAVDLMRVLPPALGLCVGDAVVSTLQGGRASVEALRELADAQTTTRGRRRLELLFELIDGRAESSGESLSRAVILWSGFEPPDLQVRIACEGHADRVDFLWPSVRAIGESDGYGKYRADTVERTVERMVAEKRREDRLRRWSRSFGRWDWADALAVAPLVHRLAQMGIPRIAAPRAALLATVGSNPRSLRR